MHWGEPHALGEKSTALQQLRYVNALGKYCNNYGFLISRGILFLLFIFFKEYIFRPPSASFSAQTFKDGSLDPGRFPTIFCRKPGEQIFLYRQVYSSYVDCCLGWA